MKQMVYERMFRYIWFEKQFNQLREMNLNSSPKILIAEDVESNFLYLKAVLSKLNATVF